MIEPGFYRIIAFPLWPGWMLTSKFNMGDTLIVSMIHSAGMQCNHRLSKTKVETNLYSHFLSTSHMHKLLNLMGCACRRLFDKTGYVLLNEIGSRPVRRPRRQCDD